MNKKMMIKSTVVEFEMANGETVPMTLNFAKQLVVRSKKKEVYERHSKAIMLGCKDIFDYIVGLYVAYLCAAEDIESAMTEEQFVENMPLDYSAIISVYGDLIEPKKVKASEAHSPDPQKQGSKK